MKIGVNTLFMIPSEVGGTETYLCQTLLALAAMRPEIGLVLFTNAENDPVLRQRLSAFRHVEYQPLGFRASNRYARILREQFQLPAAVRRSGADVLWSPGYTAPCFSPVPQVTTIPDMQYKHHPDDFPWINRVTTDVLVRVAARRSRRLIAISEFSKAEIVRFTGVAADKVDVTHLAVDPVFGQARTEADRTRVIGKHGWLGRPHILCVANTYPHKNVPVLVEAFGKMVERVPHQLVIIGRPRMGEPAVEAAIAKLSDRSRVTRIGYVDFKDLPVLYQSAAVFAFPSLYEGFGLPVLEAMMAGVPVVTTQKASIPELGGECVFYHDPRDPAALAAAIERVLDMTPRDRASWCALAAQRAATFSWKATAEKTLASIQAAMGEGKKTS